MSLHARACVCVCACTVNRCCHRFLWKLKSSEPRDTPTHSGSLRFITQPDPAASLCHRLPTSNHGRRGSTRQPAASCHYQIFVQKHTHARTHEKCKPVHFSTCYEFFRFFHFIVAARVARLKLCVTTAMTVFHEDKSDTSKISGVTIVWSEAIKRDS